MVINHSKKIIKITDLRWNKKTIWINDKQSKKQSRWPSLTNNKSLLWKKRTNKTPTRKNKKYIIELTSKTGYEYCLSYNAAKTWLGLDFTF